MDKDKIIEAIKGMTVLELNELVKACEEEFGVSAAAPVAVAGAVADFSSPFCNVYIANSMRYSTKNPIIL